MTSVVASNGEVERSDVVIHLMRNAEFELT